MIGGGKSEERQKTKDRGRQECPPHQRSTKETIMKTLAKEMLEQINAVNRRTFLTRSAAGIGVAALGSLLNDNPLRAATGAEGAPVTGGLPSLPHFAAKAKRIIYLFQSGAPSQMDLFDYKPKLNDLRGTELPDSIRKGQRLTGMTSRQDSLPVAPSKFKYAQHGKRRQW